MDDAALSALLQRQEKQLLTPEVRSNANRLRDLLTGDFVEFGSSGRIFNCAEIVHLLGQEDPPNTAPSHVSAVELIRLGNDAALLTYRLQHNGKASLRSSVWVERHGRWQMRFHQGTRAV